MIDIVIPYSVIGLVSEEKLVENHYEIEFPVMSALKFCKKWLGKIYVVGDCPPTSLKDKVVWIKCDNPYKNIKDANIIHKIKFACENIKDLSEDFLMASDDQIVTREVEFSDFVPRVLNDCSQMTDRDWKLKIDNIKSSSSKSWVVALKRTLDNFPDRKYLYQPHIWSPLNKSKFLEMCNKYDYTKGIGCIIFSLYYNFIKAENIKNFDHVFISTKSTKYDILNMLNKKSIPTHIAWSDSGIRIPELQQLLIEICFNIRSKILDKEIFEMNHPLQNGSMNNPLNNGSSWN